MTSAWRSRRALAALGFLAYGAIAVALAGCGAAVGTSVPSTLRVAGSTSMLPLLEDLSAAFAGEREQLRIEITGGGSRLGWDRLLMHEVDVAACSWLATDPDATAPQPYSAVPIGWDGIVVIVHASNRLDGLTLLQLRSVYAGWVFDWEELGGAQGDILIVSREDGSGTRAVFEKQVLGEQPVALTAIVMPSTAAVLDYVSRHPASIGYASMGAIVTSGERGEAPDRPASEPAVKVLAVEGAHASPETVKQGVYHLTRPLYLVVPGQPQGRGREFIDFVLSPAGQAVVGQRFGRIR
jgi:phosphate transport system substrate-binding protein